MESQVNEVREWVVELAEAGYEILEQHKTGVVKLK